VIDDSLRAVTAIALEDTSLVVISRDNFEKLIDTHPEIGMKFMKGMLLSLSMRLRNSFERLANFF
jgi:CRP-like cAMP-binding protein